MPAKTSPTKIAALKRQLKMADAKAEALRKRIRAAETADLKRYVGRCYVLRSDNSRLLLRVDRVTESGDGFYCGLVNLSTTREDKFCRVVVSVYTGDYYLGVADLKKAEPITLEHYSRSLVAATYVYEQSKKSVEQ